MKYQVDNYMSNLVIQREVLEVEEMFEVKNFWMRKKKSNGHENETFPGVIACDKNPS